MRSLFTLLSILCTLLLSTSFTQAQVLSDVAFYGRSTLSETHLTAQAGIEKSFSAHQSVLLSVGLDVFNARKTAEKDVEKGWGTMTTLGIRHYMNERSSGLFFEADGSLFFRTYDWRENVGFENERSGTSHTVTVFPNLNVGYAFEGLNFWDVAPMIGFGYEKHLKTVGQDVQEGFIPFVGVQVAYWFR